MHQFTHKVAGLYITPTTARSAYNTLLRAGFKQAQLRLIQPHDRYVSEKFEPRGQEVMQLALRGIGSGLLLGIVLGAVTVSLLNILAPNLFTSAPLWGPTLVIVYTAMVSIVIGAALGLKPLDYIMAGRIRDSVNEKRYAVLVHTRNTNEQHRAQELLRSTVPENTCTNL